MTNTTDDLLRRAREALGNLNSSAGHFTQMANGGLLADIDAHLSTPPAPAVRCVYGTPCDTPCAPQNDRKALAEECKRLADEYADTWHNPPLYAAQHLKRKLAFHKSIDRLASLPQPAAAVPSSTHDMRAALAELVAVDDIKKSHAQACAQAARSQSDENYAEIDRLSKEIARRRPAAWDAARAALSAQEQPAAEAMQAAAQPGGWRR